MNQNLAIALSGAAVGVAAGGYSGWKMAKRSDMKAMKCIITMAQLNSDLLRWVAEEAPAMEWDEFAAEFTEKLEYLSLVANTLEENFN